jgi:hypothetical protein
MDVHERGLAGVHPGKYVKISEVSTKREKEYGYGKG